MPSYERQQLATEECQRLSRRLVLLQEAIAISRKAHGHSGYEKDLILARFFSYVVDRTGSLSSDDRQELEQLLARYNID